MRRSQGSGRTAGRKLNFAFPPTLLALADEVIE
jgi:hypothetical protein